MLHSFFPAYFQWWHILVIFFAGLVGEAYSSIIGGGGIIIQSAQILHGPTKDFVSISAPTFDLLDKHKVCRLGCTHNALNNCGHGLRTHQSHSVSRQTINFEKQKLRSWVKYNGEPVQ